MTSDSHSLDNNNSSPPMEPQNSKADSVMMIQRDRFELLSAYLDGEVTPAERKQVEEWLANDPVVQRLHARLLKLRQGLHNMPIPASEESVQQTVDTVLERVNRRSKVRLIWGGAAIAAIFIGTLASVLPGNREFTPQIAETPHQGVQAKKPEPPSEPLLIALDKPLVAIPKAPVANKTLPGRNTGIMPDPGSNSR